VLMIDGRASMSAAFFALRSEFVPRTGLGRLARSVAIRVVSSAVGEIAKQSSRDARFHAKTPDSMARKPRPVPLDRADTSVDNIKTRLEGELRPAPNSLQQVKLAGVQLVHTLAWFSIESCMVFVLWTGFRRQSDRRAAIAAAVVATETLIFAANGFRCPLTQVAERFGAVRGSVTDIYLPRWLASNLPAIHVPLIMVGGYLHIRNGREHRRTLAPHSAVRSRRGNDTSGPNA
jgi:hypothetical protein